MGTATSPFGLFKKNEKARKQLAKWKEKVSDDDSIIHIVNQMYKCNWSSKEIMTKWEETKDGSKTWQNCQQFFDKAYMVRKRYNKAK